MTSIRTTNSGGRPQRRPAETPSLVARLVAYAGIIAVVLVATTVVSLLVITLHPSAGGPVQSHGLSGSGPSFTGFAAADPLEEAGDTSSTQPVSVVRSVEEGSGGGVNVANGGNSTTTETVADGAPGSMKQRCPHLLPGAASPAQDVYVEVDATGNTSLDDETVERLETAFANAPVTTPDGESGIQLHVVRSDTGLPESGPVDVKRGSGARDDVWDYRSEHFDREGAGYYYVVLTSDVAYDGDEQYAGGGTNGTALVEAYDSSDVMASLIMHELGHAFGISHDQPGVDSREYDRGDYESVMNYNALYDVRTYADGDGEIERDEWAFVAEDRHVPGMTQPATGPCDDR